MKVVAKILSLLLILVVSCPVISAKKSKAPDFVDVSLIPNDIPTSQRYSNLDYGLRIVVRSDVGPYPSVSTSDLPGKEAENFPRVRFDFSNSESAEIILGKIASGLGFALGGNPQSDYILRVTVTDFRLRVREYNVKKRIGSSSATAVVRWELIDAQNQSVISSTTSTGRSTSNSFNALLNPLSNAYYTALYGIDWDRIAQSLKIAKTARQEKNKEVSGAGNTALEHTVIRWYITSSPQGADVSWRVVSSTPDVANTNANYVGNTPYESTESFDIKGLTYNNSGNVQIEVTCERNGYLPQKKRFNLRQAIDQKEISAKFNLVKEGVE